MSAHSTQGATASLPTPELRRKKLGDVLKVASGNFLQQYDLIWLTFAAALSLAGVIAAAAATAAGDDAIPRRRPYDRLNEK